MPRKKPTLKPVAKSALPDFEVGAPVKIIRPHLWAGYNGVVESVNDGFHMVLIHYKDTSAFQVRVRAEDLRFDL